MTDEIETLLAELMGDDEAASNRADKRLTALAYGGDPQAQRVVCNLLQGLWSSGQLDDLTWTERALPVARLAGQSEPHARRHLAALLDIRGLAMRRLGNTDEADLAHCEALTILDGLADSGFEHAGEDLAIIASDVSQSALQMASEARKVAARTAIVPPIVTVHTAPPAPIIFTEPVPSESDWSEPLSRWERVKLWFSDRWWDARFWIGDRVWDVRLAWWGIQDRLAGNKGE